LVDEVILCDDYSYDETVTMARKLGIHHIVEHQKNQGYGANQKTLYNYALSRGADIIVMLHPDYQYTPSLIPTMVDMIANSSFDVVLGSRILGKGALQGGMPIYKYLANRLLTMVQNYCFGLNLSEYHTGYRAYHRKILESIRYESNKDDFVFDNEVLAQIIYAKFCIGEISCPARYSPESSSINLWRSMVYGLGVLRVSATYLLQYWKVADFRLFSKKI
jgi:glycosyltransferase involved in cell wall biosynthesis